MRLFSRPLLLRFAAVARQPGALRATLFGVSLAAFGPSPRDARAGAPMPCTGRQVTACEHGDIVRTCCVWQPDAPVCKTTTAPPPFVACGDATCIPGRDTGRCPAPKNRFVWLDVPSPEACRDRDGSWAEACVDGQVRSVCVPPMPTNFGGSYIAGYSRSGPTTCTTHILPEHGYPKAPQGRNGALRPGAACPSPAGPSIWTRVCLSGAVELRCLPESMGRTIAGARQFVSCPDGSCAVGADVSACPAP